MRQCACARRVPPSFLRCREPHFVPVFVPLPSASTLRELYLCYELFSRQGLCRRAVSHGGVVRVALGRGGEQRHARP